MFLLVVFLCLETSSSGSSFAGAIRMKGASLVLMVLYGVALTMVQTATTTLIQEKTEISMQGRVFGLLGSMYSGFLPIGMAVFGPMADVIPLTWIMIGSGVALIVLSVFVRINTEMRLG